MARTTIADANGQLVTIDQDSSCDLTITLADSSGDALAKEAITSLTATLVNAVDGSVINDRIDQDIYDTNGTTVSDSGVITMRLQPSDNPVIGTLLADESESHFLRIEWGWTDSSGLSRTGSHEFEIQVREVTDPVRQLACSVGRFILTGVDATLT